MKALIDGDIILYSCGFAAQHNIWYVNYIDQEGMVVSIDCEDHKDAARTAEAVGGEAVKVVHAEPPSHGMQNIATLLQMIIHTTESDEYEIFLSGKDNFRDKLVDFYKKNRDPDHKPVYYKELKEYVCHNYNTTIVDGQEADDALSIIHLNTEEPTIMCTIDKDLDMVPGLHYNWKRHKIYEISEYEGLQNFYAQILTGDSTDNIPGMYHYTGKKATRNVVEPLYSMWDERKMWEYVVPHFLGLDDDIIITNARLLWMRRKENELWEPPKNNEAEPRKEVHGQVSTSEDSGEQTPLPTEG